MTIQDLVQTAADNPDLLSWLFDTTESVVRSGIDIAKSRSEMLAESQKPWEYSHIDVDLPDWSPDFGPDVNLIVDPSGSTEVSASTAVSTSTMSGVEPDFQSGHDISGVTYTNCPREECLGKLTRRGNYSVCDICGYQKKP